MATFFRRTQVWVVDFTYEGRSRQWFVALAQGADAQREMTDKLHELYGNRARLSGVRTATPEEELDYGRGNLPHNVLCPTGRAPRSRPSEPGD